MSADTPPLSTGSAREWASRLAIFTAVGAFMGATGGFGTYLQAPLANRLVGWISEFWIGLLLYTPLVGWAAERGGRRGWPLWVTVPASVVAASIPMTLISYPISRWLLGTTQEQPFIGRYTDVLLVALPLIGVYVALRRRPAAAPPPTMALAPVEPAPRTPPFLDRLPPRLGRDLLCLEMEDHYVRAHTAAGSDLILMRMRDAVAELDGLAGLQVHRSWWVARSAVAGYDRRGRELTLTLRNGLEAPVARSSVAAVKDAGWLERL